MYCTLFCIMGRWPRVLNKVFVIVIWAPSSEFVSSSIPSWQIVTAHAQPFRGATDLAFCLKVPLDSLLVWASSEGSGETARMRRLAWTFAARIGDRYQIRLTRSIYCLRQTKMLDRVPLTKYSHLSVTWNATHSLFTLLSFQPHFIFLFYRLSGVKCGILLCCNTHWEQVPLIISLLCLSWSA